MVFKLEPLTEDDVFKVLKMSLERKDGLGEYNINISDDTLRKIAQISGGDVRTALNGLEIAVLTTAVDKDGVINITNQIAADSMQKKKAVFDKSLFYLLSHTIQSHYSLILKKSYLYLQKLLF